MDQLALILISGVASGTVYGLIGLGIVIIFRATDVVNFSIGTVSVFGMYVAAAAVPAIGLPLAMLVGLAVSVGIGLGIREAFIRPLGQGRQFAALVITLGISLAFEAIIQMIWGGQPRPFPTLFPGTFRLGDSFIAYQQIFTIAIAAVAVVLVSLLFLRTPLGTAMRASAESASTARLLGIRPQTTARIAWALGAALSGIGIALHLGAVGLAPAVIAPIIFRALAGILLGGLTSMTGAVVGGLVIGVLDNVAAAYVSASLRDTFVFSVAILVLLIRPQGLFGRRTFQRV